MERFLAQASAASASLPTTIRTPPAAGDYVPLAEHQSRTPESFFGGRPVLHYHAAGARAYVPAAQRGRLPFFSSSSAPRGGAEGQEGEGLVEQAVDVFVGSDTLTLFSPETQVGMAIPYPLIAIHAVKAFSPSTSSQCLYMQLVGLDGPGSGGEEEDEFDTLELTIVPPPPQPQPSSTSDDTTDDEPAIQTSRTPPQTEVSKLFAAISSCADLHPDPAQDGEDDDDDDDDIYFNHSNSNEEEEEEGDNPVFEGEAEAMEGFPGVYRTTATGTTTAASSSVTGTSTSDAPLPPPFPGSGGWITADNVHEFFDAEGNWLGRGGTGGGGELGEGAGRVRGRDELDLDDGDGSGATTGEAADGHGVGGGEQGSSESKRPRTE